LKATIVVKKLYYGPPKLVKPSKSAVIYHSVCKFSDFVGRARKNGFIKWPRRTISMGLNIWVGLFFLDEQKEGVVRSGELNRPTAVLLNEL
jgi:hypothetical protein